MRQPAPGGRRSARARPTVVGVLLVVALAAGAFATDGGAAPPGDAHGDGPRAAAPLPSSIVDRYLAVQPTLGDVTVVNVAGTSRARRLLAATLQGIVNRSSARIYLVGARAAEQDQHWIDDYEARGLVRVVARVTLDQALSSFASELDGFVVASYAEPWTINTATTVAAARGGVVATAAEVPLLVGLGLTQLDDHVGRWTDAATAYEQTAAAERPNLAYPGLAFEQPDQSAPRDFFVQQGIMPVYTRPSAPDFARVFALLDPYPVEHPVYGYVADDGGEEVLAIIKLSQAGRFLVPTDTTDNLSFHIAVGADTARRRLDPDSRPVTPCTPDTVNVVLALTDGDNLVIPEAYQPSADRWGSARRGTLPMGWGLTPATAVLLPAIWDHYAETATPDDEIVGLVGLGYAAPSLMPHPAAFLTDSAALSEALGMETSWSLDLLLGQPTAAGWGPVDAAVAASGWPRKGTLLNYTDFGGPAGFTGTDGTPVLLAKTTDYDHGPTDLAAQVATLLATDPAERSLVTFLPASTWTSTYEALAAALDPLVARGVRFLTPRQAFACLVAPDSTTTTTTPAPSTSAIPSPSTSPSTMATPVSVASPDPGAVAGEGTGARAEGPRARPARPVAAAPRYTG